MAPPSPAEHATSRSRSKPPPVTPTASFGQPSPLVELPPPCSLPPSRPRGTEFKTKRHARGGRQGRSKQKQRKQITWQVWKTLLANSHIQTSSYSVFRRNLQEYVRVALATANQDLSNSTPSRGPMEADPPETVNTRALNSVEEELHRMAEDVTPREDSQEEEHPEERRSRSRTPANHVRFTDGEQHNVSDCSNIARSFLP